MNTQQVRAFVAVAETLSFTKAADALSVTQPTVSYQLSAFEREMGLSLVSRTRSTVALTEAGKTLLPLAQTLLESERSLLAGAGRHQRQGKVVVGLPRIVIATTPGLAVQLAGPLSLVPGREKMVEVRMISFEEERESLLCGETDINLIHLRRIDGDPRFDSEYVHGTEVVYAQVRDDDPLLASEAISFADIADRNFLLVKNSSDFYSIVEKYLVKYLGNKALEHEMWIDDFDIQSAYVREGIGIGFTGFRHEAPGTAFIPFDVSFDIPIGLVWLKGNTDDAIRCVREKVKSIWGGRR